VTTLAHTLLSDADQSDHWLMRTVLEYSSSDPARSAAASWLAAYERARLGGISAPQAYRDADTAYRAAATRTGLFTHGWTHA
jgi:hypothetical protein